MAVNVPRKKLIEVSIPLEAINAASAREKAIRHGHPSTLHLWWARRPLASCRAVLFAQLVDDPSSWPDRFPTEAQQDAERRRLHKIIEEIVPWDASNDEGLLNAARWEIARSVAWGLGEEPPAKGDGKAILDYLQTKAAPVYDPFSGGGSIPLEAQRLGLRAYGSDINPVAVLIGKALVEIPPKFAGKPPVNPKAQAELKRGRWNGKGAQGLAEDVRYYGQWMRAEAEKRIGHLYPTATLPDGSEATVIAWIWARTVRSPDPAAKGAMVPLISSFLLSTKDGRKSWVEPVIDPDAPDGYRFDVKTGVLSKVDEEKLSKGTKTGRGAAFTCVLSGAALTDDHIRGEFRAKRASQRLICVVVQARKGRRYLPPIPEHEKIAKLASPEWRPEIEMEKRSKDLISGRGYGFEYWHEIFTDRQLTTLTTFSDLIAEVRERVLSDARKAGTSDDDVPAHAGGTGAFAYADSVATYLGLAISKLADAQSSLARWKPSMDQTIATFARQALPMVWDFAESNTFAGMAGDIGVTIHNMMRVLSEGPAISQGAIYNLNASKNTFPIRPVTVSTDPPYYDNIAYADLSDFFYVWLKRSLAGVWPDLFRRLATPKDDELVALSYRHGGKGEAEAFFMRGMGEALTAIRKAANDDSPLSIYYAFKQSEASEDGVTSAGWASFLQAVVDSGLAVDGTWPMRTELANRMIAKDTNALASSIVLVCRKRDPVAATVTRAEFVRSLKREMPEAIDKIRRAGVGPVDMQQSVIGPGMGVFSRYSKVLEDDDSAMSVRTALSLINRVWEEIENELDTNFDAETQVALAWFATYGFDARASGELITLANAKNVPLGALFASGVFSDGRGKAGLTARADLPKGWSPAADKGLTVWECVQHTARVLNAEDGGGEAAGRLVAEMGPKAADARALAYRLYEIASQKGWAAEALIYNELAQEWPKLEDLGSTASSRRAAAGAQSELF